MNHVSQCTKEHGIIRDARRRGLIIGQAPPHPLHKLPPGYLPLQGRPEKRLARLAGLATTAELWMLFDRVDLLGWCPGPKKRNAKHLLSRGYVKHRRDGHRFPMQDARLAASRIAKFGDLAQSYALVVLCGRLVAAAFGLRQTCVPWTQESDGVRYLVLPHPSGASHLWNDEVNWHRAAGTFRAALQVSGLLMCQVRGFEVLPGNPQPDSSSKSADPFCNSDARDEVHVAECNSDTKAARGGAL